MKHRSGASLRYFLVGTRKYLMPLQHKKRMNMIKKSKKFHSPEDKTKNYEDSSVAGSLRMT